MSFLKGPFQITLTVVMCWAIPLAGCGKEPGEKPAVTLSGSPVDQNTKGHPMAMMDDDKFKNVELNSLEANECSPKAADFSFRGILLNAPQRVLFKQGEPVGIRDAFARIPICGYYMIEAVAVPQGQDVLSSIRLVARDVKSGKEYSGMIRDPDPQAPPPKGVPQPSPKDLEGLSVGGYFNPNLADYVPIPPVPGVYDVQAVMGKIKSNIVRIELVQ